jgi:hypothetical protein
MAFNEQQFFQPKKLQNLIKTQIYFYSEPKELRGLTTSPIFLCASLARVVYLKKYKKGTP